MTKSRILIATAAATLFTAGVAGQAGAEHHEGGDAKVKCEGANSCKAQGDCHTASNECKGLNACKGKGWKKMTADECEKAKADMGS